MKRQIKKLATKYVADRGGNVMMMTAGSVMLFMACAAGASDLALWNSQQSKLQDAADSASLSGAIMMSNGAHVRDSYDDDQSGDDGTHENDSRENRRLKRKVKRTAEALVREGNNTTLEGFESRIVVNPRNDTVSVELSVEVPRMFAAFFMKENPRVRAFAESTIVFREDASCIYVLEPTSDTSMRVTGSASIIAPDCGIQVHSTSPRALVNTGSGTTIANNICVAGNYRGSGFQATPTPNCTVDPDPFENHGIPNGGGCDYTDFSVDSSGTLYPGTYCGGIRINNDHEVHLSPGIYYIRDGALSLNGTASISGDGVAFVLEGTGSLDVSSSGNFTVSPPTRGPLKGFSLTHSRTAKMGQVSKLSGQASIVFGGLIYLPNQHIELAGKASSNSITPTYSGIIARTVDIVGQGELKISRSTNGAKPKETVRLIH